MKSTLENPKGSVAKLSPKESVEGGNTVIRGSVRAPEGFSEGKPKGAQPPRISSQGFARGKSRGSPHTAPQRSVGTQGTLLRGQLFHSAQRIFNTCSDYQIY